MNFGSRFAGYLGGAPQRWRIPDLMVRGRGFTMAEVMVAMLFLSIAMFGYIGLHMRILHSSTTLQQRHSIRRKVDLHSGVLIGKARLGQTPADGTYPLLLNQQSQEILTPYLKPSQDDLNEQYSGNLAVRTEVFPPQLKHLTCTITWTNRHGPQSYVVDTFKNEGDAGW